MSAEWFLGEDRENVSFIHEPPDLSLVEDPSSTSEMTEALELLAWVVAHAPDKIRNHPDAGLLLQDFHKATTKKFPDPPSLR